MGDPFSIPEIAPRTTSAIDARALRTASPAPTSGETSFAGVLKDAVSEVQRLQTEADSQIQQLVSGEVKDVTEAMVAVERADVSFQTMMAIRNKMVAAYEEVMRMQV
jgi:flagellar hook-basal body complex protein FliE